MKRPSVLPRDVPAALALALALAGIIAMAMTTPNRCAAQAGDSSGGTRRRIQPLPALGSAPETGLQYGATVLAVWEPAPQLRTRPSSVMGFALRTGKGQTRFGLEGERWTSGNARRIAASLQWQEWPLPFYGIGDRAPESAREIFTPRGITGTLTAQQRIRGAWYLTTGLTHVDQQITTDSSGGLGRSTAVGLRGGRSSEFSVGLLRDTREHLYAPRGGHLVHLSYARADNRVWSDFRYGRLRLDARSYHPLGGHHVLAAHLVVVAVDGAAPFDRLALVGGSDVLRGYALGRYRDRVLTALQTEYRSPMVRGVGAVLFGGGGVTADKLSSMGDRRLLPTYGVGLRAQIDRAQRTAVRADFGRGQDGASGLYIGFNQAF
jgi:hypothetical protein